MRKIKYTVRYSFAIGKILLSGNELEHGEEYKSHYTEYDEQGNTLQSIKYNSDDELEERTTCTYDDKGNVITEETYYALDDIAEKVRITRNESGLILEEETTFGDGSTEKTIYNRFADRNLLEKVKFDEANFMESREELFYNDKKHLTEFKRYDEESKLVEHQQLVYDDKDNIVEVIMFDSKGAITTRKVNHYNENGMEDESFDYNSKGDITSKTYSQYDENGNLTERIYKDFHSKSVLMEYDENNRCIAESLYDENNNLVRRTTYEYDDEGNLVADTFFNSDVSRGGRDEYTGNRYEHEFFD